ncbi:uncharacterized protein LOC105841905 [Bombyx mori]|uniref:Uncharacterized protein n=1 Tax=Bombyx mori TaxID=7091 RepID=A0A8R2C6S7_BOMMO|nr:uncharacterized protein LOC105841905 [Bombyx mori]
MISKRDINIFLPPMICNNLREKIKDGAIDDMDNLVLNQDKRNGRISKLSLGNKITNISPSSIRPLSITWFPDQLYFAINKKKLTKKLRVLNACSNTVYIHCCGLWNEKARLGASWNCHPRTRLRLAPGLMGEITVQIKPRETSPVQLTCAALQLAASRLRENVTGYFAVPIEVSFLNSVMPSLTGEES